MLSRQNVLLLALHATIVWHADSFSSSLSTFLQNRGSSKFADVQSLETTKSLLESKGTRCFQRKQPANRLAMQFGFPSMPTWATKNHVQYFAFGSNMNPAVLRGMRQVDPIDENPGFVKGYRLAFNMMGTPGIEPSFASAEISTDPNEELHGVLYNLTWGDWFKVALTEGVPLGYTVEPVRVSLYNGTEIVAATLSTGKWSRTPFNVDIQPSPRYRELLIEGARIHNVSEAYCQQLERVKPNPFILIDTRESYARRRKARGW